MSEVAEAKETSWLEALLNGTDFTSTGKSFADDVRRNAREQVSRVAFPKPRDEEWRQTPLKVLTRQNFKAAGAAPVGEEHVREHLFTESANSRLVLVNGRLDEALSDTSALPDGCYVGTLANLPAELEDKLAAQFGNIARYKNDAFTPFNSAAFNDAVVVYVPKDLQVEVPVHVMFVTNGNGEQVYTAPRTFIYGERHSEITVVEDYFGVGDEAYFNTAVTESYLGDESHITHVKVQRENLNAVHISRTASLLGRGSNYNSYTISIGAALFRNEPVALVDAENAHATLDGLVMISGDQISDTHSILDHLKANCTSHQLHKTIVHDNAKSVFNGKIYVRKDSQLIDAFQENRNLLLSNDATVFTKPQLEIFADDVKCSHGATIGQLSEDELFYLMSRGLPKAQATQMLTYGFALEVIENLPIESLRDQLSKEIERLTTKNTTASKTA